MIGSVAIGANHPIRVQSMTTPSTTDVEATVRQIQALAAAGCEIVRVSVPSTADVKALPRLHRALGSLHLTVPLVADVHFSPQLALMAAPCVEKVRINPGNYADKKRFKVWEYTDQEYAAELERIEEKFAPLVEACRRHGTAMRIGTNHGSLSDRILNRFGDTPLGMVESALEFVRICRRMNFHELVLSMKASHPMVAIQAYRLLAARMAAEELDYPFHLGVTEAGDGEDGRVKSAIGIGALLHDGIGDTIRVSLTEDPVAEIPVALALVAPFNKKRSPAGADFPPAPERAPETRWSDAYQRRATSRVNLGTAAYGAQEPVRVETLLPAPPASDGEARALLTRLAGAQAPPEARTEIMEVVIQDPSQVDRLEALVSLAGELAPTLSVCARPTAAFLQAETQGEFTRILRMVQRVAFRIHAPLAGNGLLKRSIGLDLACAAGKPICWIIAPATPGTPAEAACRLALDLLARTHRAGLPQVTVGLEPGFSTSPTHAYRLLAAHLNVSGPRVPLVLVDDLPSSGPHRSLPCAVHLGSLLCDGIGDTFRLECRDARGGPSGAVAILEKARDLSYTILQGSRIRIVKTEFISCPSCGRTQFDLEETTRRIKSRTAHLKGLKIAVMGCVVNGPGEMADADFGYVGWGPGKVALFVGREMVARDVPTAEADEHLVDLIRAHGRWIEPV